MSYEKIREHHAQTVNELLEHLAAADELKSEKHARFLDACNLLIAESQQGVPLQYLKHCARVTDWGRIHLTPTEMAARKGPHPYYGRGSEIAYIDDYSFTEKALLIGCRSAVSTFDGKFFMVVPEGKYSVSEMFHIVKPTDEDFDYVRFALEARDAARYIKGPNEARVIELSDLYNVLIPWPNKEVRDAYAWAFTYCKSEGLKEAKNLIGSLWNANARLIENIRTPEEALAENAEPAHDLEAEIALDGSSCNEEDRGALAVAERLIEILAPNDDVEFCDVVAATSDLADPNAPTIATHLICFPAPNQGEWTQSRVNEEDPRWVLGTPPRNKANFAWIQQTIACMSEDAVALLLLCNAPLHSELGREKANRIALAQSGLLEAVVSLPGGIFDDERPASSFLILRKGRPVDAPTLLIDASNEGELLNLKENGLTTRVLPAAAIERIADTYRTWANGNEYCNVEGFCAEVSREEIAERDHLLSPWAYA
ncbi:MAG: N-6 DNA methylase [Eggerthellaceae bacterium]|nr:N-6 DNA methylase [Eggerthellaceae bacterium]